MAAWLYRWRGSMLLLWLCLLGLSGLWLGLAAPPLARMGSQGAPQSEAAQAQQLLESHFQSRPENLLAVVVPQKTAEAQWQALQQQLKAFPQITELREISGQNSGQAHQQRLLVLQLSPQLSAFEAEALVPQLRAQLRQWQQQALRAPTHAVDQPQVYLTGLQAFYYDMGQRSKQETRRYEGAGLLLAFFVLLICFGSLSAALLPLLLGVSTLLATQTVLRLSGLGSNQTAQILNSMLGLGLTIDYALFMVSRYREARQQQDVPAALRTVWRYTGRTVFFSALIMGLALCVLLLPEVDALRGTVHNLLLVVGFAALHALLVLPLLLAQLDRLLDFPRPLARWLAAHSLQAHWQRWAWHVTGKPLRYSLLSAVLLLALASPLLQLRLWEPLQSLAPADTESVKGFEALQRDGWGGEIMPIQLLIHSQAPLLEPAQLQSLYRLGREVQAMPQVAGSLGLINPSQPLSAFQQYYGSLLALGPLMPELPLLKNTTSGQLTLLQIYPRQLMDMRANRSLLEQLAALKSEYPQFELKVGGSLARARSFTVEMYRQWPLMLGLIMLSIWGCLTLYLRSWVMPLKASIMNFLPILSAFGVLVWAFQWGGLGEPQPGITNIVPLTLFCLVFGLSMDYEVLILSRIDESWQQTGEVRSAVVLGLSQSSGLITGAALILLGVFAPGVFSGSAAVQEISLGITTTILLDASLVRLLLVPGLMMLMGRWNWWQPFGSPRS